MRDSILDQLNVKSMGRLVRGHHRSEACKVLLLFCMLAVDNISIASVSPGRLALASQPQPGGAPPRESLLPPGVAQSVPALCAVPGLVPSWPDCRQPVIPPFFCVALLTSSAPPPSSPSPSICLSVCSRFVFFSPSLFIPFSCYPSCPGTACSLIHRAHLHCHSFYFLVLSLEPTIRPAFLSFPRHGPYR